MDFIDEVRNADRGRWLVVSDNPDWPPAPMLYGTDIHRRGAMVRQDVLIMAMPNEGQTDNGATTETQGGQEVSTTTETEGAGEPSTTTDTRPPDPNRPITKAPDPGSVEDREQK